MNINGQTKILGVLGYPIAHSLSPHIHQYLIEKFKLNLFYLPFKVHPDHFNLFIQGITHLNNFLGCNITVPFKRTIMKYTKVLSEEAKIIGAVNTLTIHNNNSYGYNTDVYGFQQSLKINFPSLKLKDKVVLMLGAGGASRAILYVLLKEKIKKIVILNRTESHGQALKKHFLRYVKQSEIIAMPHDFYYLSKSGLQPDLIINTTSVGLKKSDNLLLDLKTLKNKKIIVYDLIYNPPLTPLLHAAKKNHLTVMNGLDMLILQALNSFNLWTGINVEGDLLRHLNILRRICMKRYGRGNS